MKWVFPLGRRAHPDYEVLSDHADGELAPGKAMEVNAHLAVCQECREEVDFMAELRSRLRELSFGRPREDLFAGIARSRAEGGSAITPLGDIPEAFGEESGRRESRLRIAMTAAVVVLSVVVPGCGPPARRVLHVPRRRCDAGAPDPDHALAPGPGALRWGDPDSAPDRLRDVRGGGSGWQAGGPGRDGRLGVPPS